MNNGTQTTWSGVVSVERPKLPDATSSCRVLSARTVEFLGRRAIKCELPYSAVSCFFRAGDPDQVFVEASLSDEALRLHSRASLKEWAHFSGQFN